MDEQEGKHQRPAAKEQAAIVFTLIRVSVG
jgi:hypothetical protein